MDYKEFGVKKHTRSANKLSFLFVLNKANWNSSWHNYNRKIRKTVQEEVAITCEEYKCVAKKDI